MVRFIICIMSVIAHMALAEETQSQSDSIKQFMSDSSVPTEKYDMSPSKFKVGLGFTSSNYKYSEEIMDTSGTMQGIKLSTAYSYDYDLIFLGQLILTNGNLNYDGALQDTQGNSTPYKSKSQYTSTDLSLDSLILTELTQSFDTSVILGIGHQITVDANDPDPYDYRREHQYTYLNSGLKFGINKAIDIDIGLNFLMEGRAKTKLSDVNNRLPDLDQEIKGGSAVYLKLTSYFDVANYKFVAGLNYKKWSLSSSKPTASNYGGSTVYWYEPKNSTTTLGLDLGMLF